MLHTRFLICVAKCVTHTDLAVKLQTDNQPGGYTDMSLPNLVPLAFHPDYQNYCCKNTKTIHVMYTHR